MGVIEVIILFAVTTAVASWIKFYIPAIQLAELGGVDNPFTQNKVLSTIVFLGVAVLASPLLFLPTIVPSMEKKFKAGFESVIMEDDKR